MASHEHLQQLNDEDSTSSESGSSTSSSDDDDMSESSDVPQDIGNVDSGVVTVADPDRSAELERPKPKLKLSLRMPKKTTSEEGDDEEKDMEIDTAAASSVADSTDADEDIVDETEVVKATVVPSDDGDAIEEVVEATVAEEVPTATAVPSATQSQPRPKPSAPKSRRSPTTVLHAGRPVRLPSMSSPGLLITPTAGVYRGDADADGFTTPASVFTRAMSLAGYSTEGRTKHPHRGSSVERVVDDMFDSNIRFTLHFPRLVPEDLWSHNAMASPNQASSEELASHDKTSSLPQILVRALAKPEEERMNVASEDVGANGRKKRRTCLSFVDMAPVSLTIPYPESYIQKRLDYTKKVEARERAIVASQESAQAVEEAKETSATTNTPSENGLHAAPKNPQQMEIPPIPTPPSPPSEIDDDYFKSTDKERHPIRIIKGKEKFVSHLDKDCFHITDGRYYGLSTNSIADPHFVGPNAPGIVGLNISGGTGLATSASNAVTATSSQGYFGRNPGGGSSGAVVGSKNPAETNKASSKEAASSGAPGSSTKTSKGSKSNEAATSTSTDLKKFMEQGDTTLVEAMKVCITRAAVHASRTGMHGGSFVGSDGETYPDISKAFAAHAGLRPCNRCKNNKQGAYHCRLRRKHKDVDYDGGNSWAVLAPLFEEKIGDLVHR